MYLFYFKILSFLIHCIFTTNKLYSFDKHSVRYSFRIMQVQFLLYDYINHLWVMSLIYILYSLLFIVEVTNLFRWLVKAPSSPIVQSMMMSDKLMLYFKNKRKLFTSVTLSPSQCSHVMQREMKTRECHYDYASLASIIIYR